MILAKAISFCSTFLTGFEHRMPCWSVKMQKKQANKFIQIKKKKKNQLYSEKASFGSGLLLGLQILNPVSSRFLTGSHVGTCHSDRVKHYHLSPSISEKLLLDAWLKHK